MIRFYNTLSGQIEPFKPIVPGKVRLYTCGPTVYQYAHIGNLRAYMFEDLLKRFLQFMGIKVLHVMNITDVDDKTIREANKAGLSLQKYTQKYIDAFFEDIKILNILPADHYPRATEHVSEMASMVRRLLDKGYAYRKEGSVYFEISRFPEYGRLSKIDLDARRPGQRVDTDEYEKESIHDFALWKAPKEGEPSWDSEIGPGRPGWHVECSVMSSKYLGEYFDIHCGGVDNIFPHHENEIAQSQALTGKKFVNYWIHCHHLIVDGEKMSKSKGNVYTLRDLLDKGLDPRSIRWLLMGTHYRKMLNFTFEGLDQAQSSLRRIRDFADVLKNHPLKEGESRKAHDLVAEAEKVFVEGLSDDLNISAGMSGLFELIREVNILLSLGQLLKGDTVEILGFLRKLNLVLGVFSDQDAESLPAEIMDRIRAREEARASKNYAEADRIRLELLSQGIELEDTREGVRWKKRKD